MRKYIMSMGLILILFTLTACGNSNGKNSGAEKKPDHTVQNDKKTKENLKVDKKEGGLAAFQVSDFIEEADNKMTKAMGGRAKELTVIPAFPDADKHFSPSTDDFCLICAPAVVYRDTVETKQNIARFDLISFDADGEVDSHYQAFVFDSAEEADQYHEFRKERDGIEYRELYAGSNLSDNMMTGCAKRYDNVIYFNMDSNTVGMEEAYTKSYLVGEQSFYEGIGYTYLYSLYEGATDTYGHYEWTEGDNEYFYPTSHRFTITKQYSSYEPDGIGGLDSIPVILYTLYNYDEQGNLFSKTVKGEFPDEAALNNFISEGGSLVSIVDYELIEHDPIGSSGRFIYDFKNVSATGTEPGVYFTLLGEEYMERDADYKDGQYPEAGMGKYYFYSCRDRECPIKIGASLIIPNATIEEPKAKTKTKTDKKGIGSFEAYFCSEEIDTILNKPSCEIFVTKDGKEARLHLYEYQEGVTRCEFIMTGNYDDIFKEEQVSTLEAANPNEPYEIMGECTLTMIDHDNLVIFADFDEVMLDYMLHRAEHTLQ